MISDLLHQVTVLRNMISKRPKTMIFKDFNNVAAKVFLIPRKKPIFSFNIHFVLLL